MSTEEVLFGDGMAMPQLVRAVRETPMLSAEEGGQAEALEQSFRSRGLEKPVALEAWLLKVAMTAQYAAGLLERFGLPKKALDQFYVMYTSDQEAILNGMFPSSPEEAKKQLLIRMQAYDQVLHVPRSGDAGRDVAALFCRFLDADKETALADFAHDLCSQLNIVFTQELERLKGQAGELT